MKQSDPGGGRGGNRRGGREGERGQKLKVVICWKAVWEKDELNVGTLEPALSCYRWRGWEEWAADFSHDFTELYSHYNDQKNTHHIIYHISRVRISRGPDHSAPAVNIFSGCERSRAAFPTPIITAIQFTTGLTFISVVRRKKGKESASLQVQISSQSDDQNSITV